MVWESIQAPIFHRAQWKYLGLMTDNRLNIPHVRNNGIFTPVSVWLLWASVFKFPFNWWIQSESPRVCRRPKSTRGYSRELNSQVFTRGLGETRFSRTSPESSLGGGFYLCSNLDWIFLRCFVIEPMEKFKRCRVATSDWVRWTGSHTFKALMNPRRFSYIHRVYKRMSKGG